MDFLPEQSTLFLWLEHYGSLVLFILLALGIIALPVPEETLMIVGGILMRQGVLNITATPLAAFGGSITGITISYLLGRTAGHYLVHHYGNYIGLTEKRLERIHIWFEKLGKWTLFIGYFIPGVRHFTGFFAGMTELHYKQFALFAYSGAIFWVSTFLGIGYFFGGYCFEVYTNLKLGWVEIISGFVISIILLCVYKYKIKNNDDNNSSINI